MGTAKWAARPGWCMSGADAPGEAARMAAGPEPTHPKSHPATQPEKCRRIRGKIQTVGRSGTYAPWESCQRGLKQSFGNHRGGG